MTFRACGLLTVLRAAKCRRGGVVVQIALALTVILGFVSLGIEVSILLHEARRMQAAADSSVVAAARTIAAGYAAGAVAEARAVAAEYGYTHGADSVTVTLNRPPSTGNHAGEAGAVEILISQPQTLPLASLFQAGVFQLTGHAVALASGGGGFCVLSLDTSVRKAVNADNDSEVLLDQCGLAANSSDSGAVQLDGGAVVSASTVSIVGGYRLLGGARLIATGGIQTGAAPVADPYAAVAIPAFSGCTHNRYKTGKNSVVTLNPGVYCNGIAVDVNSRATLNPGIYLIDRGNFDVAAGARVSGSGVAIVLTTSTGSGIGVVGIAGGAGMDLTAPGSGSMAGFAFFQDRRAATSGTNNFAGGNRLIVNGALYFPRQRVTFSGGGAASALCQQIVSRMIVFSGPVTVRNECAETGVQPIGGSDVALVE